MHLALIFFVLMVILFGFRKIFYGSSDISEHAVKGSDNIGDVYIQTIEDPNPFSTAPPIRSRITVTAVRKNKQGDLWLTYSDGINSQQCSTFDFNLKLLNEKWEKAS